MRRSTSAARSISSRPCDSPDTPRDSCSPARAARCTAISSRRPRRRTRRRIRSPHTAPRSSASSSTWAILRACTASTASRCATQRLRSASGSARRGGRRRDLLRPAHRRRAAHDLRRWRADARLRVRRRRGARESRGGHRRASARDRGRQPRLQHWHGHRDGCGAARDAAEGVSGGTSELVHAPARAGEQRRSAVRNDKAGKVLGWQPKMSLRDGLRETYQWFAARRAGENRMTHGILMQVGGAVPTSAIDMVRQASLVTQDRARVPPRALARELGDHAGEVVRVAPRDEARPRVHRTSSSARRRSTPPRGSRAAPSRIRSRACSPAP